MAARWNAYARDYSYARGITIEQCCRTVRHVMELITQSGFPSQ